MNKTIERLLSYIPTKLPHGMPEFERWSSSIIGLSNCPDNDSTRFTVAVMILHLDPSEDVKAKHFFVKKLNKAAANELANSIAMELKKKQQERAEQEAKDKAAEAQARDVEPNQEVS